MTAHGPEARRLVEAAFASANLPDVEPALTIDVVGHAIHIATGTSTREGAIHGLAAKRDLAVPYVTKLLDVAVEALTADPQE